jgi:short-subunit dehydrogenase
MLERTISSLYVTRAFLPSMIERNSGNITFVQSPAGHSAWGSATCYISARYALHGLFESLSCDLVNTKIKVNEMTLGLTSSNYFVNNKESYDSIPVFGRLLGTITPQQAATAIVGVIERNKSGLEVYPLALKAIFPFRNWILVKWLVTQSGKTIKAK